MLCATGGPCGPGGHRLPTERLRRARTVAPATQYRYHRSAAAASVLEPVPGPEQEQVRAAEAPGQPSAEAPGQPSAEAPGRPSVVAAEAAAEDTAPWPQRHQPWPLSSDPVHSWPRPWPRVSRQLGESVNSGPYPETLPLDGRRSRREMVSTSVRMASPANLRRSNERAASCSSPAPQASAITTGT